MIEGLNIRCDVGPVEVLRSPSIDLVYRRRAVLTRAELHIPDPEGEVRAALEKDMPMRVRFGYRGEVNDWHEWEGTIAAIDQPAKHTGGGDAVIVQGVGLEKALTTTVVTESFNGESAAAVAQRLFARTGLPVGAVDIPDDVLPHQVFSRVPVARAIKQLEYSLTRAFGRDMTKHAVWLGANGLMWSAGNEPGPAYAVETAVNLLNHTPPTRPGEMGAVSSVLLPGLTDGMEVRIRDARRDISVTARAEEVRHRLRETGNSTTILYGKDTGWG